MSIQKYYDEAFTNHSPNPIIKCRCWYIHPVFIKGSLAVYSKRVIFIVLNYLLTLKINSSGTKSYTLKSPR